MTEHRTHKERDFIHKAIRQLDPEGTLVPGTEAYEDTATMIAKWIDDYGLERAVEMVRKCMALIGDPGKCTDLE